MTTLHQMHAFAGVGLGLESNLVLVFFVGDGRYWG